ncbi:MULTISPECIES: DUF2069 domain-containing protein [Marinobacter]|uniref:DUF2069 domain-containing protein n=1 Tax=Marinobacter TaxID=2742 RepID=UPI000DAE7BD3|nr:MULTISPECIES: DUF2069 domain-containing protein [Marinobacter]
MLQSPRARLSRHVCQWLFAALLVMLVATTFYPAPDPAISLPLILSVKLLPLVFFTPAVWRGHNRGLIWLAFVLIFYFTQFVVGSWLSQGALAPVLGATLTLALFVSAMVHLKLNRPELS